MGTEKVVWILGSGFSKPLGGPLLADLFRPEREEDIAAFLPDEKYPDLARMLPWVQEVFRNGVEEGHWKDAEQFLSYVDDAYQGSDAAPRIQLLHLIERTTVGPSPENDAELAARTAYKDVLHGTLNRKVKRALAADCHRFLMRKVDPLKSGDWFPYTEWVKSLTPHRDTVISFNYDLVIETAAQAVKIHHRLNVALPDEPDFPPSKVPILKLHGSVNWRKPQSAYETITTDQVLKSQDEQIEIAHPGTSKEELARGDFKPLWSWAERALTEATRLIVVGYSFPPSDSAVQYRLLRAFTGGIIRDQKAAHVVLGADASAGQRVVSLLLSTAPPNGTVRVAEYLPVTNAQLVVVRHPNWAQDVIGRRDGFTVPRAEGS